MKHLKVYENFNKSEIDKFCSNYNINDYEINEDGSIDVNSGVDFGSVKISKNKASIFPGITRKEFRYVNLSKFKFKFNSINGDFVCYSIGLKTLENSPNYIKGSFWCSDNNLTTLIGGPKFVGGSYYCDKNNLLDLYGFPESFINHNNLSIQRTVYDTSINPVCEIVNIFRPDEDHWGNLYTTDLQLRFIRLLNEYKVIRNGKNIIESRLLDALSEMGIKELDKTKFKHYKLI